MAESMSDTVSAGSDDATTLYCQPCGNVLADAFCRDCSEYLCSGCSSVHEKLGMTKNHTLLKGAAMPTSFHGKGKPGINAGSFQKCPKHPVEELKFFCQKHETVCCMACSVVDHKQCNTAYIPDLAKNYMTGPEYRRLMDEIKETEQLAAKRLIDIDKKMNWQYISKRSMNWQCSTNTEQKLLSLLISESKTCLHKLRSSETKTLLYCSSNSLSHRKSSPACLQQRQSSKPVNRDLSSCFLHLSRPSPQLLN